MEGLIVNGLIIGIAALIGAFMGAWAVDHFNQEAAIRARTDQVKSIRAFTRAEIEFNLKLLNQFWVSLNRLDNDIEPGNRSEARTRKLAYLPFPCWSKKLWANQLAVLLLQQEDLVKALDFYNILDYLTALQAQSVELVKQTGLEYPQYLKSRDYGVTKLEGTPFQEEANKLWQEFYRTADGLIARRNPL
jgi:hypothetical protein